MSRRKPQRIVDVHIAQFSKEGHGIGSATLPDGTNISVEVPFTIPGDIAKVILLSKRKGVYNSLFEELIKPSHDRVTPRCIHFASCGGCRWQQITYEQQLSMKEAFVKKCFAPHLSSKISFLPIVPCDPPWHYRNKMEFSFSNNKAKERFLGLILHGGKGRVFNITECHLTNKWFVDAAEAISRWWKESDLDAYHMSTNTGSLRTLTLREGTRTGDRMAMLTVSGNPEFALKKQQLESFVAFLRDAIEPTQPEQNLSIFLRIQQVAKGSPTNFYEMHLYGPDHIREILNIDEELPLTFHISPTAFFQPNTRQAERLYSNALALAEIPRGGTVYDLYCGTGTLGICAAKYAKQVVGIELSPESVLDARANTSLNSVDNFTIHQGDVGQVLNQLKEKNELPHPDLVMVDPPRVGLDAMAIKQLLELKPQKILYISCNPVTQSANIGSLIEGGYELIVLQPVDQFPQTVHIENIAVLIRKS